MLKAPPSVAAVAPSAEATLKLKPMLRRWLIKARALLSGCVAACEPVGSHYFIWLVVGRDEMPWGVGVLARVIRP